MKHTELLKLEDKGHFAHGIEVDSPPASFAIELNEIGIIAKMDNGSIDFDVIDACIGYIANSVKVMLEVPFELDFNEETLTSEAMVTGYDLSIFPPFEFIEDEDENSLTKEEKDKIEKKTWDKYKAKLCAFMKAWLNNHNNKQMIFPISGFFGYMVGESLGYQPKTITEDPYIESVYVKNIPLEVMDDIKDELRVVIYEVFGGKEEFESYCHSLAQSTVDIINGE